jgi:hypothetical protein
VTWKIDRLVALIMDAEPYSAGFRWVGVFVCALGVFLFLR